MRKCAAIVSTAAGAVRRCDARSRIGLERFAQKSGFGERRGDASASRVKIFSLPKFATQSPRNTLQPAIDRSQGEIGHIIRSMLE